MSTYAAPGMHKARKAEIARAYRARKRSSGVACHECDQLLEEVAACTCTEVRPAAKPLRRTIVKRGGAS